MLLKPLFIWSLGEHRLQPGKHEFPFTFPLPVNCPSSFEGEYGHIRYEMKVVVDRAFKFDQEKKIALRVIAPLDLNADPYASVSNMLWLFLDSPHLSLTELMPDGANNVYSGVHKAQRW